MHILTDIGNSTVVAAIADAGGQIAHSWRFKTRKEEIVPYFRYELKQGLRKYNIEPTQIESVAISSVVPEVDDDMTLAITDLLGLTPHFFTLDDVEGLLSIDVESPGQLGVDRLADAVGAVVCYGSPAIIIDFGTATTVGIINDQQVFCGGLIIPGVKTSLTALTARASQLPTVNVERPRHLIGRSTLESMQSGIVYGTSFMIDGLIDQIAPMFARPPHLIATGGMSRSIVPYCRHQIIADEHLLLKGLYHATHKL